MDISTHGCFRGYGVSKGINYGTASVHGLRVLKSSVFSAGGSGRNRGFWYRHPWSTTAATRFRSNRMNHLRPPRCRPFLTTTGFPSLHSPGSG
jgi:hypothetical protein